MTRKRIALGVLLAAVALLALGAGSASAACPGSARTLDGVGSSLQRTAFLEIWRPGYTAECPEVTLTYEALGSGAGLERWSAFVEGAEERTAVNSGFEYIGTDDVPTSAQLLNIRTAARGTAATVVPVAGAAISVIVNLPTGCRLENITNSDLEAVFRHTITRWRSLANISETTAGDCERTITRVVRKDVSGTTFQFKHYLWLIRTEENVVGARSWLRLQGAEISEDNLRWPAEAENLVRPAGNGGGEVVRTVRETTSSIGYASVSDSASRAEARVRLLSVQVNGAREAARYASPLAGEGSNCESVEYRENLGNGTAIGRTQAERIETDYSTIYGTNIATRSEARYGICTLTFLVIIIRYVSAGFPTGTGVAVGRYEFWKLSVAIQELLRTRAYAALPSGIREGAAIIAESRIGD